MKHIVQRHQSGGLELAAGFAESLRGDDLFFERRVVEHTEKLIQLGLKRTARLVKQKKDQITEGEIAFSGEIARILAMSSNEFRAIQQTG